MSKQGHLVENYRSIVHLWIAERKVMNAMVGVRSMLVDEEASTASHEALHIKRSVDTHRDKRKL